MVCIINYNMGNLRSVQKAFSRIGADCRISNSPYEILQADKLVLPGVGHFSYGMYRLKAGNLVDALNESVIVNKTPILGICLGMQLMTSFSEEGAESGLGWVDATTQRFNPRDQHFKVPHMGWNNLAVKNGSPLFNGLSDKELFYFVHSYYVSCKNEKDVATETTYANTFVSSFRLNNIFGCQFHPEKSHDAGLRLLKNFSDL